MSSKDGEKVLNEIDKVIRAQTSELSVAELYVIIAE